MKATHKFFISVGLALVVLGAATAGQAAAPQAGTIISNQASASFKSCLDDACTETAEAQSVTSNLVETVVQAVPAFTLDTDQTKPAVSGEPVNFPHTLSNTGNVDDTYQLCVVNVNADVSSWALYPDANNDGQPDIGDPLFDSTDTTDDGSGNFCWTSSTRVVAAGEQLDFVIEATPTGTVGQTLTALDISAESSEDPGQIVSNTDSVLFPDGPVFDVVKSLSENQGASPSGNYTVTLRYRNISNQTATNLVIEDELPTEYRDLEGNFTTGDAGGMTYVADSARWSLEPTTPLTDDDDGTQTLAGEAIDVCAYDSGSTDCTDLVRATLASVAPGAEASLSFEVSIDADIPATSVIANTASYAYENQDGDSFGEFDTNTALFTITDIAQNPGVVANNTQADSSLGSDDASDTGNVVEVASIGQGGSAQFDNIIWNTGDGVDSFDIEVQPSNNSVSFTTESSFPDGTVFQLLRSDGATPLTDTTGSGTLDTGPIPVPDSSGNCPARFVTDTANNACGIKVVLKATVPPDALGGPFDVTKVATSNTDASVSNAVTDRLTAISENSVDITNDAEADGNGGAPGEGADPAGGPINTNNVAPGNTTTFNLFINNTGARQDSYALAYSDTLSPFEANQLPDGWQVEFFNDGGNGDCSSLGQAISSTALIPKGGSQQVCAEVTAPDDATGGTEVSVYFRALSQTSGAEDIKHDQVVVSSGPAISLTPDQFGQVEPGSAVVYTHQVANTGNVPLTGLELSATPLDDGWSVVLFEDTDGNGEWSADDTRLDDGDFLATDNSVGELLPGEEVTVFARLFAPSEVSLGTVNIKTLEVVAAEGVSDTATDTTTANNTDIIITKRQAPDTDCDGQPDSGSEFDFVFTGFEVAPGDCVAYELVATNQGAATMNKVTISDRTQSFTVYNVATANCMAPTGSCTDEIDAPVDGGTGPIDVNVGSLAAGEKATLIFGLKVRK